MLTTFRDLVWRKNEAQNLYGQAVFLLSTLLMCYIILQKCFQSYQNIKTYCASYLAFFVLAFLYDTVIAVRGILCMYVRLLCTGVYSAKYIKKSEAFLQNKKELYAEGIEKQYIFTA